MVVKAESQGKEIYLEDRSGAELDDKCGMAYFWNRLFGGKGIVPKEEALALTVGSQIHEDMHTLANLTDISEPTIRGMIGDLLDGLSIEDRNNIKGMEILYRRLGWFIAWALFLEPTVRLNYDTVSTENEMVLARDPLWVSVTPDRVLRHKKGMYLEVWDFKSTISASTKWMMSWQYRMQGHLLMKALEEELVESVKFTQFIGMMKGYEDSSGNLMHPYVWAYHNTSSNEWTHEYKRGADWVKLPVWTHPKGLFEWVKSRGLEVARNQFPMSPPVHLNEMMLDDWIVRRKARQTRIHQAIELVNRPPRNGFWPLTVQQTLFEKRQANCRPAFGDACPYLKACWNAETGKDPLKHGEYIPRTPHHQLEIIGVEL